MSFSTRMPSFDLSSFEQGQSWRKGSGPSARLSAKAKPKAGGQATSNAKSASPHAFRFTHMGRSRLVALGLVFLVAYLAIGARLVFLGIGSPEPLEDERSYIVGSLDRRSDILDRNGRVLAKTLTVPSVSANPRMIRNPKQAARAITSVLPHLDVDKLEKSLSSDASFVWIERGITPQQKSDLNWQGIVGLEFQEEQRRIYPHGRLAAHVVGFTDIDNQGLAGLESSLNGMLTEMKQPVSSAIDLRLQHILYDEISKQMAHFEAKTGSGVLMDVQTGEVLSLVSLPSYDPQAPGSASHDELFNHASQGVYELGSVFKLFTVAMALDDNVINEADTFDISKPLRVANRTIRDFHQEKGRRMAAQILEVSSNIGAAQIALMVGSERQRDFLDRLGFLSPAGLELPEVGSPLIPDQWRQVRTATVSYGHGISVSPLQLATGVAALVNGGYYVKPTLLKVDRPDTVQRTRVMKPETSLALRAMMEHIVLEGTGKNSAVEGYRIGGKTGTADKPSANGYDRNNRIASFVSAFPMENPRYVLSIVVDEPQGRADTGYYATGGVVAAPVSKKVISRAVSVLGIAPSSYAQPDKDSFWHLMKGELD